MRCHTSPDASEVFDNKYMIVLKIIHPKAIRITVLNNAVPKIAMTFTKEKLKSIIPTNARNVIIYPM